MKYEEIKGGLRIDNHGGGGYFVVHEASNLTAVGYLRQRRFAEQARDELLATRVDFTQPAEVIQASTIQQIWAPVYHRWRSRTTTSGDWALDLDHETFEYYPAHTRYGQFIPSEAQAAEMRELAEKLKARGRVRVSEVSLEVTGTYVNEFARMGLVVRDDDELIWAGAA